MRPTIALVALAMLTATACTTTAVLHETTPVRMAAAPPPPPEPEPEPEPPPRVEVEAERIRVDEKIHFEIDSAEIDPQSDDLIQEIAQVLNDNPHVKKVRIEGHTDNTGAAPYNLDLSRRRARSVLEALVENGVNEDRLVSEGYGLTRPIESNDTVRGRAANRRVEFNIVEQDAPPAPAAVQGAGQAQQGQAAGQAGAQQRQGAGAAGTQAAQQAQQQGQGRPQAQQGQGAGGAGAAAGDDEQDGTGGDQ